MLQLITQKSQKTIIDISNLSKLSIVANHTILSPSSKAYLRYK